MTAIEWKNDSNFDFNHNDLRSLPVWEYVKALAIALVLASGIRAFVVQAFAVPTPSYMTPAAEAGDHFLANRLIFRFRNPQRGDVIVARHPQQHGADVITRVIGLPGERVIRDGTGAVTIDGVRLDESYATLENCPAGELLVPAGHYLTMRDRRSAEEASFLIVPANAVIGLASFRYWPPSRMGWIPQATYGAPVVAAAAKPEVRRDARELSPAVVQEGPEAPPAGKSRPYGVLRLLVLLALYIAGSQLLPARETAIGTMAQIWACWCGALVLAELLYVVPVVGPWIGGLDPRSPDDTIFVNVAGIVAYMLMIGLVLLLAFVAACRLLPFRQFGTVGKTVVMTACVILAIGLVDQGLRFAGISSPSVDGYGRFAWALIRGPDRTEVTDAAPPVPPEPSPPSAVEPPREQATAPPEPDTLDGLLKHGRWEEALRLADAQLASKPGDTATTAMKVAALTGLAAAILDTPERERFDAARYLKLALELDPTAAEALRLRAQLLLQAGQEEFSQISVRTGPSELYSTVAVVEKGDVLRLAGDDRTRHAAWVPVAVGEATGWLSNAVVHVTGSNGDARVEVIARRAPDRARALFSRAVEIDPRQRPRVLWIEYRHEVALLLISAALLGGFSWLLWRVR